jgi:hypothetical protein
MGAAHPFSKNSAPAQMADAADDYDATSRTPKDPPKAHRQHQRIFVSDRIHMAVALVLNGIPDLQLSMVDGLECLKVLLADRQSQGCTIIPTEEVAFGVEYRIQHPDHSAEVVYLTDYPDPANDDWDVGG